MRNKDSGSLNVLRLVLSSIKLAEIETGNPLDDSGILNVIQKEVKSRREAISDAEKANRDDLIQKAEKDISLLESYLPKQLSESELENLVKLAIEEVQANSPADMGKVMKALMPRVQGKAAGNDVSRVVKKLLIG